MAKKIPSEKKGPKAFKVEVVQDSVAVLSAKHDKEDNDSEDDVIDITDYEKLENLAVESKEIIPSLAGDLTLYDPDKAQDPLTYYLKQVGRYKLLSIQQEKALTDALAETGDIEIAKELVAHNLRLVVKIAMEYRTAWQNVMDLIQEGNIGLMKAVSKYDGSKGAKLSYYASWWIRSYILKFILDNFRLVKIGSGNEQKKLFYNLMKEKNRLLSMGIEPSTKKISENLGVSEKAVSKMDLRLSSGGEVSIDNPVGDEAGMSTLGAMIPYQGMGPEDLVSSDQELGILKSKLHDFLSSLKVREQDIFKKRLLTEAPPSLQEIGDEYGVSRERIRQIEERLLKKLKVYMSDFLS